MNQTGASSQAFTAGYEGQRQIDGAPASVIAMSHPHWHNFPVSSEAWNFVFAVLYMFFWVISAAGNGVVIYVFSKSKSLRTPANMLIVNLAVADFAMMLTQAPMFIISAFSSRWWIWGHFWCRIYGYAGGVTGITAIFTMVWIAYDRYNIIVKGMSGRRITRGIAFLMILSTWIYANVFCLPPLLQVWSDYKAEGLLSTCSFDYLTETTSNKQFAAFIALGAYAIPISLLVFFYTHIVKAVWVHEATLKRQAKRMSVTSIRSNADQDAQSAEIKIAKVALYNVLLWVCIWTPYGVVCMIGAFGDRRLLTPIVTQLPSLIAKCASVLNPFVYALSHPRFRRAAKDEVPLLCIHEPDEKRLHKENESRSDAASTTTET